MVDDEAFELLQEYNPIFECYLHQFTYDRCLLYSLHEMQDAGIMSHRRPIAYLLAYHIVVIVAHGFIGGIFTSGPTAANAFEWTPS